MAEAQARAILAHLRAESVEHLARLELKIAERLAQIRNGDPGAAGDKGEKGDDGAQGAAGPQGEAGPAGVPGANGPAGPIGPSGEAGVAGAPGEQGPQGPPGIPGLVGPSGSQGERGERGLVGPPGFGTAGKDGEPGAAGKDGAPGAAGERGEPGIVGPSGPQGERGLDGGRGERGLPGATGAPGAVGPSGPQGERGFEGPPGPEGARGKMPIAKAYEPDAVHYVGDVVVHLGGTWQAVRDTGQAPPHRDWIALSLRGDNGRDGSSPQVRGLYQADASYGALDIVALNGGSFIARRDNPGPCPGEGWQSLVMPGKQGKPGEQGPAGEPGPRGMLGPKGEPGAVLSSWHIEREAYTVTPILSDGRKGPSLNLRKLFEQFNGEIT